ncbi:hypothetical protein GL982_06450 [Spiroplasma citri]|uniref:Plectrovirus-related protein n=2 Tax=Spiroplasma citri TaxID=2133 RepID=A0AAJ4EL53_SPICI|nr:hypothetical protein FRX96_07140 [Spiroplasma citri]QIA67961.1 hypothetical protein GMI18_07475 [Spiroplasma citri]QIA69828.1 hypothetical protein GL298_07440 [Spiroplasma citri]QIA71714.1 hypothetical protein GL981_07495 [Spiroplasma citri]QIA73815.1 hypothetical protein GL982_06450 [Spiroplasma citri]
MDAGTTGIIKAIEDWAGTLAKWAGGFTTWFLAFLGANAILIIPIVLMFVVLGIETLRKLIHGY